MQKTFNANARLATLDGLLETVIPAFLNPPPSRETLRAWFDAARIPRFKANPSAKRGGGQVYYSVVPPPKAPWSAATRRLHGDVVAERLLQFGPLMRFEIRVRFVREQLTDRIEPQLLQRLS